VAVVFVAVLVCKTLPADDFFVIPLGKKNPAPVPRTGQTACYNAEGNVIDCTGTGQDGALQAGAAWPVPRFTDHGNGTVTDHLTGLVWTKDLDCHSGSWQSDLDFCNALASGTCGLTDGSQAGDWRLTNFSELLSLIDRSQQQPVLPAGHPFDVNASAVFISSTTALNNPTCAWEISIYYGDSGLGLKTGNWGGACVRGGR